MFYSPARIALLGMAAWLLLWLVMPIKVLGHLNLSATIYMAVCYAGFFIGIAFVRGRQPIPQGKGIWSQAMSRPLFWSATGLGLLGLTLRIIDRVVFRNVAYTSDVLELREALEQTSSSFAGIVGATLLPMCMVPLMLVLGSNARRHPSFLSLSIVLFLLPTIESLAQLSRSVMLLTVGMAFALVSVTQLGGRLLNRKLVSALLVGAIAFALVSSAIFSARIEAGRGTLIESVFESGYAETIQPSEFAWENIVSGSDTVSFFTISVLPNGMYYLSGIYELSLLFDRPDAQQFAYGRILFYPYLRAFDRFTGGEGRQNDLDLGLYLYREGIWQTFFGPLWADFGWLGFAVMTIFGFISQAIALRIRRGRVSYLPLYLYLSMVIFFFPVINFFTNGLGLLAVTAFVLFALLPGSPAESTEIPPAA